MPSRHPGGGGGDAGIALLGPLPCSPSHLNGTPIDRRLHVLCDFTLAINQEQDRDELLHQLASRVADLCDGAKSGIMLVDSGGKLRFVAASEDAVVEIERYQEQISEGACFHAFEVDEIVPIADIAADVRWPGYRDRVLAAGMAAVLGLPLHAFGQTIGVMNVYRPTAREWEEDEIATLRAASAIAAAIIVHDEHGRRHESLREGLEAAIASRDVIGQAKGVLMEREGVDSDTAFELLRAQSQRRNRRLRDVAEELLASPRP